MTPSDDGEPSEESKYTCCSGSLECAVNKSRKFMDRLFALYEKDKEAARDHLWNVIEELETSREMAKMKRKEAQGEISALKKEVEELKGKLSKG